MSRETTGAAFERNRTEALTRLDAIRARILAAGRGQPVGRDQVEALENMNQHLSIAADFAEAAGYYERKARR